MRHDPVAVLREASPPHRDWPVYPGATEIGARRPARIIIDRPEVSSRHACLECRQGPDGRWRVSVFDRESTNGTYVNGERVRRRELKTGDRVRFATADYEIRYLAMEEPRVTVAM